MKKVVSLLLALVLCLSMAACSGGDNVPDGSELTHTCAGAEWVVKEEATCAKEGIKEHVCTCGKVMATETIPLGEHTYVDGVCEVCGGMDPNYYPESFGLEFVDIGGGELKLVGMGSCTDEIVVIPEYQGSLKVVSIERKAFLNNRKITAVIIPDSVKIIGEEAFKGCTKLTSVIIGDGVETISKSAFSGCENIATVEMGSGVKTIGQSAFSSCESLAAITIPKSVTKIDMSAFSRCKALTTVTIPNNPGLKLDTNLFAMCSSLHTVVIENGIETVPNSTFYKCTSLVDITLPNTLKVIGIEAFKGCSSLENITLPNGVTKIWNEAFRDCTALTQIVIPESVTALGTGAFYSCTKLKKVTINASTALEYQYQFEYCDALEEIAIPENLAEQYASGWKDMAGVMQLPNIPGGSTTGSQGLYYMSRYLGEAEGSVCTILGIGSCTDTAVVIPSTMPDGSVVTAIADRAFMDCLRLESVDIPAGISLGDQVFDGCANLKTLTIRSTQVAHCPYFHMPSDPYPTNLTAIYVPADLVNAYKEAVGWQALADIIQPIP